MPDGLYDTDFYVWAERQAALLRRLAAGERVNEAVDWPNLIEEVQDLGRSELHAVESLLTRALEHLMKIHGWPDARDVQHWRNEVRPFLLDARRRFTPGMRQKADLQALYEDAYRAVSMMVLDGEAPRLPPPACPYALEDLLPRRPVASDVDVLLAKLDQPPLG